MKVLLIRNVEKVGSRGEIVEVSEGYARNFLLPRKLAAMATEGVREYAGRLRKAEEKRRGEEEAKLDELAGRLEGAACSVGRRAHEDGKLFGSVTAADIADALSAQGLEVERKSVLLPEPIKTVGVFPVTVKPGASREATVKVSVVREEDRKG